jgi:hypothetical protein
MKNLEIIQLAGGGAGRGATLLPGMARSILATMTLSPDADFRQRRGNEGVLLFAPHQGEKRGDGRHGRQAECRSRSRGTS